MLYSYLQLDSHQNDDIDTSTGSRHLNYFSPIHDWKPLMAISYKTKQKLEDSISAKIFYVKNPQTVYYFCVQNLKWFYSNYHCWLNNNA